MTGAISSRSLRAVRGGCHEFDGTLHKQPVRMNLTLAPVSFPSTLPIVRPIGDTAACAAPDENADTSSRERRLRAFVSRGGANLFPKDTSPDLNKPPARTHT